MPDVGSATGHDYEVVTVPRTATEKGYVIYTCKNCGHSYRVEEDLSSGANSAPQIREEESQTRTEDGKEVIVHSYSVVMVKGESFSFGDGSWTSDQPKTVSVEKANGTAKALKKGTALLTNTAENDRYEYTVSVIEPSISEKEVTMLAGETKKISLVGAENLPQTWLSSDESVAKAILETDEKGPRSAVITGTGKGTAKLTAYVGGVSYTTTVKVSDAAASSVKADESGSMSLKMNVFQSITLKKSSGFIPSGASWTSADGTQLQKDAKGTWNTADGTVSITKTGKLTGLKTGTVSLIGTDGNDRKLTLTLEIRAIPVKSVVYLNVGKQTTLKHTYVKDNKKNTIQWTAEGDSLTLVNPTKAAVKIKGKKAGSAVLRCSCNGEIYETLVIVEDPSLTTDTMLSRPDAKKQNYVLSLSAGGHYYLQQPGVNRAVAWKSSKPSIVTVNEYGMLEAKGKAGQKATISAKINGETVKVNLKIQ